MSDQNNEPMESLAAQVARMNIGRIPQDEGGLSTSAASDTDMAMPLGCGDDDDDDMYAAAVPLDASDFQPLAAQAAATLGALTPDEVAAQQTKSRDLASIKERLRSRALEAKRKEAELLAGYLNKVDPYNPIDVDKALATLKSTPAKPGLGAKRVGAANPEVPVEKEGGWFSYLRSTFVAYKFEPIDRIEAGVLPAPLYRLKDLDLSPSGKGDTMTVKAGHHVASFGGLQMSTLTRFPQAHVYPAISHQIMKRDFIGASVSAKVRFTFPHPLDPENKVDIDIMPILAADEDQGSVHNTQIWVAYVGSEGLYIELRFDTDDSLRYVVVVVKRDEAYMMEGKQTGLGEVLLTPQEDALAKYILAGKAMDVYSLTSTHLLSPVAAQSAQFSLSRALTTIYAAYPKLQMSTLVGGQRAEPGIPTHTHQNPGYVKLTFE
jgi:hypothetical protein